MYCYCWVADDAQLAATNLSRGHTGRYLLIRPCEIRTVMNRYEPFALSLACPEFWANGSQLQRAESIDGPSNPGLEFIGSHGGGSARLLDYRKCLARLAANSVEMLTPRRPGITSNESPALSAPELATAR